MPRIEELFDRQNFVSTEGSIMVVYKLPGKQDNKATIEPTTLKIWNTKLMLGKYSLTLIQRFSCGPRQEFVGIMKLPDASDSEVQVLAVEDSHEVHWKEDQLQPQFCHFHRSSCSWREPAMPFSSKLLPTLTSQCGKPLNLKNVSCCAEPASRQEEKETKQEPSTSSVLLTATYSASMATDCLHSTSSSSAGSPSPIRGSTAHQTRPPTSSTVP